MSDWSRRSVLTAVAALPAGTVASAGAVGGDRDEALPDPDIEATPDLVGGWPSHRGDAGHARYVADGPVFEGGTLEANWSIDHHDEIAVADGTVYATIDDGVVALDAADGALVWENPDVAATAPSVDGERVFLTGTEVVALDRSNGRVRWRTDFGTDEAAAWQTVAYGGVYVVVNGVLYALEPEDGSVRWDVASIDEDGDESGFVAGTAAANGVVYAATERTMLAYDPDTGEEVWRRESDGSARGPTIQGNATAVISAGGVDGDRRHYDAQTGAVLGTASGASGEVAMGESVAVTRTDDAYRGRSLEDGETEWILEATTTHGRAAVAGETVYAVVGDDDGRRLVALDERDGSERWSVDGSEGPLGPIRAITEDAIYVASDGALVALRDRSGTDDGDDGDRDDDGSDSRDDSSSESDGSDRTDDDGSEDDSSSEDDGSNRTGDDGTEDESEGDGSDRDRDDGTDRRSDGGETDSDDADGDEMDSTDEGASEEPDGTGDGAADADDERSGDNETEDDTETVDDGTDDATTESEAEPESTDEPEGATDDVLESDDDDTDDAADAESDDADGDAADLEDGPEGMPGFTAGAGIAGGALGLEWLRRRANAEGESED
ncbi:PQQ-binding-like beta-propeller repeat protein [Natronococcus sp. A-GB7]|uniref:outer membrane protein assembly factor BamB family protein n=1 Tax=Natronococcus sp. A-GB7 TaxID=3037649 RepID=UPI00241E3AC4|nr:PQQ-binding-like beta-propeller repeat protein [Natronococcus sp. A-GB7]MDG5821190.1 PQQ-binding-like beta-propeller repeat protein [Natronococcus sp. A-GB7]